MMEEQHVNLLKLILENWQILFLYIFKYLNDISQAIRKLEVDINVLKYANNIKESQNESNTK